MSKSYGFKKRSLSLPHRRKNIRNDEQDHGGFEETKGLFEHDTEQLLIHAKNVMGAATKLQRLQKQIYRKRDKIKSKELPKCEEDYLVNLKYLQEAANKITQHVSPKPKPKPESNPRPGRSAQLEDMGTSRVDPSSSDCEGCLKRQAEIWKYEKSTQEMKKRLNDSQNSVDQIYKTHVPKADLQEWKQKFNEEKAAKEDALRRLSAMASSKLRDNNPNITDLSDVNRPTKIGEKMSELYDNEWTDAFDELQKHLSERDVVQKLLDVLKAVFDQCKDISTANYFEMVQICIEQSKKRPDALHHTKVELPDTLKQQIKEFRKFKAVKTWPYVQELLHQRMQLFKEPQLQTPNVKVYVNKCIELCWMMVVQDPPLFLSSEVPTKFDTNRLKDYTCRGPYVEYLVWPTLYLHEGGAVLIKGVAQGCKKLESTDF